MRKKLFKLSLLAVCIILFNACNSDELTENASNEDWVTFEENPYVLDETSVLSETSAFLQNLSSSNPSLRSASIEAKSHDVKVKKIRTTLAEKSSVSKQVTQEVPVYILQYKDEANRPAGYTVTVGDNRFDEKVIMFNDKGEFADFDNNEFWKERIEGYIYNTVNKDKTDEKVSVRAGELPSFIVHFLDDWGTSWHQYGKPYSEFTPFRGGQRASAGCTTAAMAEIMAYHFWPLRGAYERYDDKGVKQEKETSYTITHWFGIKNNYYNYRLPNDPVLKEHISNLFAEIAYKLNTNFVSNTEAYASPLDVSAVFKQMGYYSGNFKDLHQYYNENRTKYFENFNEDIRKEIVEYRRPVYMGGWKSSGWKNGHAFIIIGVMTDATQNIQDLKTVAYYYINSGNAGSDDGWYLSSIFKNPQNPETNGFLYPYRYDCGIIKGIYPNNNNMGSTSLYRVSTKNPY